jgi:hypothetical protein
LILLANSRLPPMRRSLGKISSPGKLNPGPRATPANSPAVSLLVKRGRFGAEASTKSLENEGDTSRGQAQITKSAGEPNTGELNTQKAN